MIKGFFVFLLGLIISCSASARSITDSIWDSRWDSQLELHSLVSLFEKSWEDEEGMLVLHNCRVEVDILLDTRACREKVCGKMVSLYVEDMFRKRPIIFSFYLKPEFAGIKQNLSGRMLRFDNTYILDAAKYRRSVTAQFDNFGRLLMLMLEEGEEPYKPRRSVVCSPDGGEDV